MPFAVAFANLQIAAKGTLLLAAKSRIWGRLVATSTKNRRALTRAMKTSKFEGAGQYDGIAGPARTDLDHCSDRLVIRQTYRHRFREIWRHGAGHSRKSDRHADAGEQMAGALSRQQIRARRHCMVLRAMFRPLQNQKQTGEKSRKTDHRNGGNRCRAPDFR